MVRCVTKKRFLWRCALIRWDAKPKGGFVESADFLVFVVGGKKHLLPAAQMPHTPSDNLKKTFAEGIQKHTASYAKLALDNFART